MNVNLNNKTHVSVGLVRWIISLIAVGSFWGGLLYFKLDSLQKEFRTHNDIDWNKTDQVVWCSQSALASKENGNTNVVFVDPNNVWRSMRRVGNSHSILIGKTESSTINANN